MTVSRTGSTPTPFGFVGSEQYQSDPDSGLMLLGHRYYDPSIGRFITSDPVQDGDNWYAYCGNNPLGGVDPEGTDPKGRDPWGRWFPTPDAAAVAAIDAIYPKSGEEQKEYGGYIVPVPKTPLPPGYQGPPTPPGYTPTYPVKGDRESVDLPRTPPGAVAWYHTHPYYNDDENFPSYDYEHPSQGDTGAGPRKGGVQLPFYIGTGSAVWRVDLSVGGWGNLIVKERLVHLRGTWILPKGYPG